MFLLLHIEPSTVEVGRWLSKQRVISNQFHPLNRSPYLVKKPKIVIIKRCHPLALTLTLYVMLIQLYWCQSANMKIIWLRLTEMRLRSFWWVHMCVCLCAWSDCYVELKTPRTNVFSTDTNNHWIYQCTGTKWIAISLKHLSFNRLYAYLFIHTRL